MDQTTQQNAALVEEAAAASESLREQAAKLSQTVAVFRLDGARGRAAQASVPKSNVTPLKKKPVTAAPAEPLRVKRLAGAGRGDDWEEF
jgi:methyl-accepting chemotaxis protein